MGTARSETRPPEGSADWSPEFALLGECAVPPGVRAQSERARRLLRVDLSWETVLDLAGRHGVLPLLDRHVETASRHSVPDDVRERLRDRARSTTVRNMRYATELHRLFEQFEDAGVRAIPFKGPVLAATAYGDLSLRAFNDLDVLVHPGDISTAVDCLDARGYEWVADAPRLDDSAICGGPVTMPLISEYELEREELTVELRPRVGEPSIPFGLDVETLWARRSSVRVAGVDLPGLDALDRLLMLAYHGTKHRFRLLKWLADFAVTVLAAEPDWRSLFARAEDANLGRRLRLALVLAVTMFGVGVPAHARSELDDERVDRLAASVRETIGASDRAPRPATDPVLFNARAADGVGDALGMLVRHQQLHPSLFEYELCPLPGALHPLYYPLVPARFAAVKLRQALGLS